VKLREVMVAMQWAKTGRSRKPFRQRQRGHSRRRALTVWVTRSVLAVLLVVMAWMGSQFPVMREYLRLVFVPGAAAVTPWAVWLDWQPQGETITPVWVALTGRQDARTFDWPVESVSYTAAEGGVYLSSARGVAVKAVLPGRAVRIDNVGGEVTLDHGSGMQTIYRGLGEVLVQQGDEVTEGQIIGRMGTTERLFFALSLANRLVDPTLRLRSPGPR